MSDDKYDILNATVQAAVDGEEPRILSIGDNGDAKVLGTDDPDRMFAGEEPEEEMIEIEWLPEGTKVSVTAPLDINVPEKTLTLTGTVCGTAAIPLGRDIAPGYIVKLDDPSQIPTEDGAPFEYTCVAFPVFIVNPIKKVEDNG